MASRENKKPTKPANSRAAGIRTLSDLNRLSGPDSDSDSDNTQEHYTGGEKSGMLVQDPSKKNDVNEIFSQAKKLGAVEGPVEHPSPSPNSGSFTGTGRLLSGGTVHSAPQRPEAVIHNIVFWSNGFTVNDGPLRTMNDPENEHFLESIKRSECPKELQPADRRSAVHVNLIRRDENCPEPEKKLHVAFQGVGRTLSSSSTSETPESSISSAPLDTPPNPRHKVVFQRSLPFTSIQIRLADGTRLIKKFNLHHTVNDIRAHINSSRPEGATNYQLQAIGFPPKLLTNPDQTIEEAGIANSVVIQKF